MLGIDVSVVFVAALDVDDKKRTWRGRPEKKSNNGRRRGTQKTRAGWRRGRALLQRSAGGSRWQRRCQSDKRDRGWAPAGRRAARTGAAAKKAEVPATLVCAGRWWATRKKVPDGGNFPSGQRPKKNKTAREKHKEKLKAPP